jgi:serine/threonine protein phosphatase 1
MRLLAIGDIHGCLKAFDNLLALVAPRPEDQLIVLGDYVDRGPNSAGVLDRLIQLQASGRLIALRGNHEEMMLQARFGLERAMWLACGGRATLASYGIDSYNAGYYDQIPEEHWDFLDSACRDYYETEHHFFVHANVFPEVPLDDQPTYMLFWEQLLPCHREPHCSGKIMVCGHTRQLSGLPLNLGHAVCIDTGVYDPQGWLTCLDVVSGHYWQADQVGRKRQGQLPEPNGNHED